MVTAKCLALKPSKLSLMGAFLEEYLVQGRQLTGETINTLTADYIQSTVNPTPQEVSRRQELEVDVTHIFRPSKVWSLTL